MKPGLVYGETDPFGFNIAKNPVQMHDVPTTVLHHLLGIDRERLTYKFQGRCSIHRRPSPSGWWNS